MELLLDAAQGSRSVSTESSAFRFGRARTRDRRPLFLMHAECGQSPRACRVEALAPHARRAVQVAVRDVRTTIHRRKHVRDARSDPEMRDMRSANPSTHRLVW